MTDLDHLVRTLSTQEKLTLLQIWHSSSARIPYPMPPAIRSLITKDLVTPTGTVALNQRGVALVRSLDTERQIDTCDRFLDIVSTVLACGGEVSGLEQAFSEPHFTAGDRDLLAAAVDQLREAIEKAGEQ